MPEVTAETLVVLGFIDAGAWVADGGDITYRLDGLSVGANEVLLDAPKALYAFVRDNEVQYIGKTARTIRQRFGGYRRPGKQQRTNLRCNSRIKEALRGGSEVRIFVFSPIPHLRYLDFEIDLAAGLEDSLIAEFRPPWNGRENGRPISEETEREEVDLTEVSSQSSAGAAQGASAGPSLQLAGGIDFAIVLGPAYFQQGFINPGVSASEHLGKDGEPIEVLFNDGTEPVVSKINRTANRSGGVRVVGRNRLIAQWFQRNFRAGETVKGRVLDANHILLSSKLR